MGYYREIDGKKFDGDLLDLAEELVKGRGDGRISRTTPRSSSARSKTATVTRTSRRTPSRTSATT
jgi:hypothetical protein